MLETVISNIEIEKLEKSGKKIYIECPHCKAQYMPGEIYMPGALIGNPVEIVKDALGKIIYVDYLDVDNMPVVIEHFTCEYCNKAFEVEAGFINYKSKEAAEEEDFSSPYVSLL
jgi:hypothetical protein